MPTTYGMLCTYQIMADAHVLTVENLLPNSSGKGDGSSGSVDSGKSSISAYSKSRSAAGLIINISNGRLTTFRDLCLAVWAQFGHVPALASVSRCGWRGSWVWLRS